MCGANACSGECSRPRSFNYDSQGRRVNPQGGHYMIPADQFASVVARARWDPRILNCFRFVPLPAPGPRCPLPAASPHVSPRAPSPPTASPFVRRR